MADEITIFPNTNEYNRRVRNGEPFGRSRTIYPDNGLQNTLDAAKQAYVLAEAQRLGIDTNTITIAGVETVHTTRGGVTVQPVKIYEMRLGPEP